MRDSQIQYWAGAAHIRRTRAGCQRCGRWLQSPRFLTRAGTEIESPLDQLTGNRSQGNATNSHTSWPLGSRFSAAEALRRLCRLWLTTEPIIPPCSVVTNRSFRLAATAEHRRPKRVSPSRNSARERLFFSDAPQVESTYQPRHGTIMKHIVTSLLMGCVAASFVFAPSALATDITAHAIDTKPKARVFRFDYGATANRIPNGAHVRVWLPVPQTNEHQEVRALERSLPAKGQVAIEPRYGNKVLYFEVVARGSDSLSFKTSYLVRRSEVQGLRSTRRENNMLTDEQRRLFLTANQKVPLSGRPLQLLTDIALPNDELAKARALYDRVDEHVRYDKSQPGYGNGDVLWVCDSQFGNCTDFHSLFISLARSQGLPARFEIGFPLPPQRGNGTIGGYHCWALFHTEDRGWVPVDISEADKHPEMKSYYFGNLTEDRVTFATGRDIDLVPGQAGPPLNFFVYPHIEIDGKPLAKDQIELSLEYSDDGARGGT